MFKNIVGTQNCIRLILRRIILGKPLKMVIAVIVSRNLQNVNTIIFPLRSTFEYFIRTISEFKE